MQLKKNHIVLVLKLAVIAVAFAVVLNNSDTDKIAQYLLSISPLAIILAYILLFIAQTASALRMQYYYKSQDLHLNSKFAIGLYFTGMFYNTILPGGIGGDAYKVYLIGKLANFSKLKSLRLLLADRANGLFILMMLGFVFAFFSSLVQLLSHAYLLLALGAIITVPSYFIATKILLKEQPKVALGALPYSLIVQLSGVLMVVVIIWGTGVDLSNYLHVNGYIMLFLISSVLAILPISIGGVGVREVAFMYGATLLGLDPELGVAVAVIFFIINLICSLNGLFFWHRLDKMFH